MNQNYELKVISNQLLKISTSLETISFIKILNSLYSSEEKKNLLSHYRELHEKEKKASENYESLLSKDEKLESEETKAAKNHYIAAQNDFVNFEKDHPCIKILSRYRA